MHCSAALAVTWLSHSSQYIFRSVTGPSIQTNAELFLIPLCWFLTVLKLDWRLESTRVHSPGKEHEAWARPLNHQLHRGTTNAVWEAVWKRQRPPGHDIYPRCPWIKPPELLKLQWWLADSPTRFDVAKRSQGFQGPSGEHSHDWYSLWFNALYGMARHGRERGRERRVVKLDMGGGGGGGGACGYRGWG